MKIHNVPQRSEEWHLLRLTRITGSRASKVYAKNNLPLVDTLLAEAMTGYEEEIPVNKAMQWGIDHEDEACALYAKETGLTVSHCGICIHDVYDWMAVSPDGWIDEGSGVYTGAVEIKCPKSSTHVSYLRQGGIPHAYRNQVLQYFMVNEDLEWLDFVSYDPRNMGYPLFVERVTRDELQNNIDEAWEEMKKFYKKFKRYLDKLEK